MRFGTLRLNTLRSPQISYTWSMRRRKYHRAKQAHYCLLVNKAAAHYDPKPIDRLTKAIRQGGGHFTILEPDSPMALLRRARQAAGVVKTESGLPPLMSRRGKVTSLVACGGDGTFNLVARAALQSDLPVGILPLGRYNNVARSICGACDLNRMIDKIIKRNYCKIDHAEAAGLPFFASIAMGFVPRLAHMLENRKQPRFGLSWSSVAGEITSDLQRRKLVIKVDAFRFEITPWLFSIHLLPYAVGLAISPPSMTDDHFMETVFDVSNDPRDLGDFLAKASKGKYVFGREIRLYRGTNVTFQPTKGQTLYFDGEMVSLPTNIVEVKIGEKQLKVFC